MIQNILMPIMTFMTRFYHSSNFIYRFASGFSLLNSLIRFSLFIMVLVLVSSCEEVPTPIGTGLLPGRDFVTTLGTDTMSVRSYTMYNNSFRSDNPSVSYLGQLNDPYFGTTTAEFVTQIRLAAAWGGGAFTIDSVKLNLHISVSKGNADVTHNLRLSEISSQIYTDSTYYSNRKVDTTGYGISLILPTLRSDTINDIEMVVPNSFGEYLTRDTSKLFYSNSKPDFRTFFKGFYFRITPSDNPVMLYLSLISTTTSSGYFDSYFSIYYHDGAGVSKVYYFVLDATNTNASFNLIRHDFSTATLGNKMANRNDTVFSHRDTLSYLQYLNGVYTLIKIPGLETLKKSMSFKGIGINKARISIPIYFDGTLYTPTTVSSQIILRYNTKDGSQYVVPDYNIDSYHSFFGGVVDSVASVYTFNIPGFVQGYLNDLTDNLKPELELFQGYGTQSAILKANNSKTPVKFDFTYTKF
jgi:hypothetical protein